jgi:hypothetical protein
MPPPGPIIIMISQSESSNFLVLGPHEDPSRLPRYKYIQAQTHFQAI